MKFLLHFLDDQSSIKRKKEKKGEKKQLTNNIDLCNYFWFGSLFHNRFISPSSFVYRFHIKKGNPNRTYKFIYIQMQSSLHRLTFWTYALAQSPARSSSFFYKISFSKRTIAFLSTLLSALIDCVAMASVISGGEEKAVYTMFAFSTRLFCVCVAEPKEEEEKVLNLW